jgi:hypothetical protein
LTAAVIQFAFDRSARTYDADGRLHVTLTNISKANICPYYGKEIPGYQSLGLDADKIYQLLRAPEELAKGSASFNNIPLLSKHIPVTADEPRKDLVVGSTGTDAVFNEPFLQNSLVIWDAEAIAGIETKEQCELSCAYRYIPVMTQGHYEGQAYDGIMTNLIGNHVALVEVGRAGRDVVVSDEDPFKSGVPTMSKAKKAVEDYLKPKLAQDQSIDLDELLKLSKLALDAESEEDDEDKTAEDEDDDDEDKPAEDEEEDEDDDSKAAMDAAISKAKADAVKQMQAIRQAEKAVYPIIGDVAAMDSAEAVYKLALDHAGIETQGVHPSAYPALIQMHLKSQQSQGKKAVLAMDSASASEFKEMFPTAGKLKRS